MAEDQKDAINSGDARKVKLAAKATPPTYAEPGKPDVPINVGMDLVIYVPSLNAQKAGFTPYRLDKDGKTRIDATTELLTQYAGIYKPFTANN